MAACDGPERRKRTHGGVALTMQRLSTWLALRFRERDFQSFLQVSSELEAARKARELCQVVSRSEIDFNPAAATLFHEVIRKPYFEFTTTKESHV